MNITVLGGGDASSNLIEACDNSMENGKTQDTICTFIKLIQSDKLPKKKLNDLKRNKTDIKNIEEKYFLSSTDDFKELELAEKLKKNPLPSKIPQPKNKFTTIYKKSNFLNSSSKYFKSGTSSSITKATSNALVLSKAITDIKNDGKETPTEILYERKNQIKKDDIKTALDELEQVALGSNLNDRRNRNRHKTDKSKNKIKKKDTFRFKLYNFTLPKDMPENAKVKCPPFKMLLDHTIAVILKIFKQNNNLQPSHLIWALFFLKALTKNKKNKELVLCIKKIKDYLSDISDNKTGKKVEYKISVQTVIFENIKSDSNEYKKLKHLQKRCNIPKEGRDALNIITKLTTALKISADGDKKDAEKLYGHILNNVDRMEAIFSNIIEEIQSEKLKLLSSFRTNHGTLAISLCSIEKDLNEILDVKESFRNTQIQIIETISKLTTIKEFLSLFKKRNSIESKFNDSVDCSLKKLRRIRRSLENVSECMYSNIIL